MRRCAACGILIVTSIGSPRTVAEGRPFKPRKTSEISIFGAKNKTWGCSRHPVAECCFILCKCVLIARRLFFCLLSVRQNQVFLFIFYFLISAAGKAAFPPEPPKPSVASVAPPIPSIAPPIPKVPLPPGLIHRATGATGLHVGGGKVWHSLSVHPRFLSLELCS